MIAIAVLAGGVAAVAASSAPDGSAVPPGAVVDADEVFGHYEPLGHLSDCPWDGGDAYIGAAGRVVADGHKPWQNNTILAETTVGRSVTVYATLQTHATTPGQDQHAQLFILDGADQGTPARGGHLVDSSNDLFTPDNVIAAGTQVRTSDTADHRLAVTLPPQTQARDYYVYVEQQFAPRCLPRGTGWEAPMIGRVRVDA